MARAHTIQLIAIPSGRFIDYLLNRPEVKEAWRQHTEHDFVSRMANGSLPIDNFKYYLIQDYLYLVSTACRHASIRHSDINKGPVCPGECLGSLQS